MFYHEFDFDPTSGFSREELLMISPPDNEPADFKEFWRSTKRESETIQPDLESRRIWSPDPDIEVLEVRFNSWAGVRIGGWLIRPSKIIGGILFGHGYGARIWPDMLYAEQGFACFQLCVRGFGLSSNADIPWQTSRHVLHGIESRDCYVLRGAAVDHWMSAGALLCLCSEVERNLCYSGSSFGGGMGAIMLAWDERFRAAHLGIPTFGHHPLRLKHKSMGSGESVRQYALSHPEVVDVLAYYDAALHARRIRIPVICSPALFDPAVIPPGQFAISNALGEKAETFVLPAGHFRFPGDSDILKELDGRILALFTGDKGGWKAKGRRRN